MRDEFRRKETCLRCLGARLDVDVNRIEQLWKLINVDKENAKNQKSEN